MSLRLVDFLQPEKTPWRGAWLLAAGVAALVAANICDQRWSDERQRILQARQAQADAQRASRLPTAPTLPSAAQRRLQHAQAEMQRPFLPALRAIEAAAVDPVYLLNLSFEPAAGTIRLEAEAPSFNDALTFTQKLAENRPGSGLASAHLAAHETATLPDGRSAIRFTVLARWRTP